MSKLSLSLLKVRPGLSCFVHMDPTVFLSCFFFLEYISPISTLCNYWSKYHIHIITLLMLSTEDSKISMFSTEYRELELQSKDYPLKVAGIHQNAIYQR